MAALVADGADDIVVVDNDAAPGPVEAVRGMPGVRVLSAGRNLGYAGGCNYAASHATGDVLVFVNSDALVQPGALAALVRRVAEPDVGLASASIRLAEDPAGAQHRGQPGALPDVLLGRRPR